MHSMSAAHQMPGVHPVAISRPQVGIERLPTRRMSNEPRESMNCKSCRKRKVPLTLYVLATLFQLTNRSNVDQMQQASPSVRGVPSLPMPMYIW
jgi:hypothetical protein